MLHSEIQALCHTTAEETGLPLAWVEHHVQAKAGSICRRCGGSGVYAKGICFKCQGTGGSATPSKVRAALDWVRDNVDHVRDLGEAREKNAPEIERERQRRHILAVAAWKQEHYDEWCLVESMMPCDFKDSMIKAVESLSVTERQLTALQQMVASKKISKEAPSVGALVHERVFVTRYGMGFNYKGERVLQIEFKAENWSGRAEIESDQGATWMWWLRGQESAHVLVQGIVTWRKDGFAILGKDVRLSV